MMLEELGGGGSGTPVGRDCVRVDTLKRLFCQRLRG